MNKSWHFPTLLCLFFFMFLTSLITGKWKEKKNFSLYNCYLLLLWIWLNFEYPLIFSVFQIELTIKVSNFTKMVLLIALALLLGVFIAFLLFDPKLHKSGWYPFSVTLFWLLYYNEIVIHVCMFMFICFVCIFLRTKGENWFQLKHW